MARRRLEHHITIILDDDDDDDEEAIPHAFRRFIMQSLTNGRFDILAGDPHFSQHISFGETVTGKGTAPEVTGILALNDDRQTDGHIPSKEMSPCGLSFSSLAFFLLASLDCVLAISIEKVICSIPLLRALSHEKAPLSKDLISALHQEHTIRSLLKTDEACREIYKRDKSFPLDLSKSKSLKSIRQEKQAEATKATGKLIAKQYRQMTLHLHPDRHGETFRREFDALQVACEILKDPSSRAEYIDTMIEVIEKCKSEGGKGPSSSHGGADTTSNENDLVQEPSTAIVAKTEMPALQSSSRSAPTKGNDFLQMANTAFIVAFMTKKEKQDNGWKRYKEKTGRKSELYLEASIFSQPPKALRLDIERSKTMKRNGLTTRVVKLPPLSSNNVSQYQEACSSISIYATSNEPDKPDVLLSKLKGKFLADAFDIDKSGWVTTKITLPDFGVWNVYWLASLEYAPATTPSKTRDSPKSGLTEIICETSEEYDSRARLPTLVSKARQVCSAIQSSVNQWNVTTTTISSASRLKEYEQKHAHLTRQISDGQDLTENLWTTFEQAGYGREVAFSRQKELNDLVLALEEAKIAKGEVLDLIQRIQSRQTLKGFKRLVADIAKQKELAVWIQSVRKSDVTSAGGTCNRLYQLLMEGKAQQSEMSDNIAVFLGASGRKDLFSEKQCSALASKAKELGCTINERKQPCQSKSEGPKKKDLKPESTHDEIPVVFLRQDVLELGTVVVLQGLKQRPDLNGMSGRYVGVGEFGRYNILLPSGCLALKLENFVMAQSEIQERHVQTNVGVEDVFTPLRSEMKRLKTPKYDGIPSNQSVDLDGGTKVDLKTAQSSCCSKNSKRVAAHSAQKNEVQGKGKEATGKSSNRDTAEVFMWLPEHIFPRFIGRNGENIHAVSMETRTRMFVDKTIKNARGHVALRVEGTSNAIRKATKRVEAFLQKAGCETKFLQPIEEIKFDPNFPTATKKGNIYQQKPAQKESKNPTGAVSGKVHKNEGVSKSVTTEARNSFTMTSPSTTVCSDLPTTAAKPGSESVQKLTDQAFSVATRGATPTTVPESIYVSCAGTGEEASLTSQAAVTNVAVTDFSSPISLRTSLPGFKSTTLASRNQVDHLLPFLHKQSCCLKRSADDFYRFLVEMDVANIADFIAAIDDKHFLSQMRCEWVKGFKVETMRSAAIEACRNQPVSLDLKIIPGGLGDFRTIAASGATIAEQMPNKEAPIGTKMARTGEDLSGVQVQSDSFFTADESLFWGTWN